MINQLLDLGIIPIINENDAVSANQGYQLYGNSFSDNDSLASMVAVETDAQLLILLTDVEGVFDRPPKEPDAKLIDIFTNETDFQEGNNCYIYATFTFQICLYRILRKSAQLYSRNTIYSSCN